MSEERLDKEQQIQDLSEMVNAQWKEIDRLKILLKKTEDKIISIEDSIESPEANSPPPHY
ncbi:MAG: SlyX family protein [Bdellovibrionales bacterium]